MVHFITYTSGCTCNDTESYACPTHPLMWGSVKMIHATTTYSGYTWAHIVEDYEAHKLAHETETERKEREAKVAAREKELLDGLKQYKMNKFVNRSTGCMVPKNGKVCKYANKPSCTDSHGIFWAAGCEIQRENKCPYMHPDEEGYLHATNYDVRGSIMAYTNAKNGQPPLPPAPVRPSIDSDSWRPIETPSRRTRPVAPAAPIKMRTAFSLLNDSDEE